ncbi:uncharacterized protein [Watersipora subatra]|uniref:uncharacterized protein n=1 Tax=Watersipora subatra TaxID=2589382 RepID=UPI00355B32AB
MQELPNGFDHLQPDPNRRTLEPVEISTGASSNMSILPPTTLPSLLLVMFTSSAAIEQGVWGYYEAARNCKVFMLGSLKSGTNIIATYSVLPYWSVSRAIDIYSATDFDSLAFSACIILEERDVNMCLAPKSDVLIVSTENKISVYFLSQQKFPDIDVTLAYSFDTVADLFSGMIADPRGFLFTLSQEVASTTIWDLAIDPNSCQKVDRSTKGDRAVIEAITHLEAPDYHPVILQGDGCIWDCRTNKLFSPMLTEYETAYAAFCAPGEGKWKHRIILGCSLSIYVFGVNTPSDPLGELEIETLVKEEVNASRVFLNADGKMILADSRDTTLYWFDSNLPSARMLTQHDFMNPPESKDTKFEELQIYSHDVLFADEILIVSGGEINAENPQGNRKSVTLFYSTSEVKLIKRIPEMSFHTCVYFKAYKLAVMQSNSQLQILKVGSTKDLNIFTTALEKKYGSPSMLDNYSIQESRYNTNSQPYLYFLTEDAQLLRLDPRLYETWSKGEGVMCLGNLGVSYYHHQCRISQDYNYLAGVSPCRQRLLMYKVFESSVEYLGEHVFNGDIKTFALQKEVKYVTVVLESSDVYIMKFLDPTNSTVLNDVNRLECIKNSACRTAGELMKDVRWTAMKDVVDRETVLRDENMLYNFVKDYVIPKGKSKDRKVPEPRVGSKEFKAKMYHNKKQR